MAVTRSRRHTERAFAKARFRCPRCRYTSTMLLDISARGRAPGDIQDLLFKTSPDQLLLDEIDGP